MPSRVVTASEMRDAEAAAFASGTTPEKLMDEAAAGIAATVAMFFPMPGHCVVVAGKGNNGGDAIAAAELLQRSGWSIDLRLAYPEAELGELPRKKLASLRRDPGTGNSVHGTTIVLDGLLGVGAVPPLREPIRGECRAINRLRGDTGAYVFAIDLPTGIDSDSGDIDADCVVADFTLAIGFAKRGLVVDGALNHVGRLRVIPLVELTDEEGFDNSIVTDRESLRHLLLRRQFGAYKNEFGRVGIVAGSKGFTGAALLCSLGALRAGAGLVELFVPEDIYPVIAASAAPEVMVKPIASYSSLGEEPIDVWAVGPGLGQSRADEIRQLIQKIEAPAVLDADALNILSRDMSVLTRNTAPRLLTPHPGEMKRLFPHEPASRAEIAGAFCAKYSATLLFKGSRTIVAEAGRPLSYNTTGNPGMATGGMGDVLTGVCAALIAQKLSLYDAARCGAWLCGRAAEIAVFNGNASEQSLLPSDVLDHLGAATKE
ncbi:MAG: NAD(P)H-hydrate dehydratase, partial [Verrucomicrobiota bacterium]|nr:NAD(P)H-hydrate dehydratase [Verrucomicrobiota bacterium]